MHPATIAGFLDEFTSQMVKEAKMPSRLREALYYGEEHLLPWALRQRVAAHEMGKRRFGEVAKNIRKGMDAKFDVIQGRNLRRGVSPEEATRRYDAHIADLTSKAEGMKMQGQLQRAASRRVLEPTKMAALSPAQLAGLPASSPLVRSTLKRFGRKTYDVSHLMNKPTKKGSDVMNIIRGFRG